MDCGPGDHPREPHSRPKQRAQTRCSLAAAVRLRVASEEMSGAEVVHTFVATMRPDGGAATALRPPRAIASWSDAIRLAGSQAAAAPICPSALAQRGAGLRSFDRRSGRCDGVPAVSGVPEPQRIVPEPQRMWCRSCRCAEPPQRELGQGDEIGTEQKNQTNKKADKDAGQQEPKSAHHSPRHACLSRARRINSAASTTSCRAASSTCSFST